MWRRKHPRIYYLRTDENHSRLPINITTCLLIASIYLGPFLHLLSSHLANYEKFTPRYITATAIKTVQTFGVWQEILVQVHMGEFSMYSMSVLQFWVGSAVVHELVCFNCRISSVQQWNPFRRFWKIPTWAKLKLTKSYLLAVLHVFQKFNNSWRNSSMERYTIVILYLNIILMGFWNVILAKSIVKDYCKL